MDMTASDGVCFCSQFVSLNMPEWLFVVRDTGDRERLSSLDRGGHHGRTDCLFVNAGKLPRDERKVQFAFPSVDM